MAKAHEAPLQHLKVDHALSTSSFVLCIPRLSRSEPVISSYENLIAFSTCDCFCFLTEHADPVEAATPFSSSLIIRIFSIHSKNVKCALFGILSVRKPFSRDLGISFIMRSTEVVAQTSHMLLVPASFFW